MIREINRTMSGYSEDDIRAAAEAREWVIKQISDKQEEVERYRTILSIIDDLLKQGSFKAAASIGFAAAGRGATAQLQETHQAATSQPAPALKSADNRDIRPLNRAKDDFCIANAELLPNADV